jgi:hypothetical protein
VSGVELRIIQVLLGHSDLSSTTRYAQVATHLIANTPSPFDRLARGDPARMSRGHAPEAGLASPEAGRLAQRSISRSGSAGVISGGRQP